MNQLHMDRSVSEPAYSLGFFDALSGARQIALNDGCTSWMLRRNHVSAAAPEIAI